MAEARDGSRLEMDHGRRKAINPLPFYEDIAVMGSYTHIEITYFDFKLRSYNRARICRHTVFQRHGSTEYDAKHNSALFRALFRDNESCTNMPEFQC
jgi:hypothetical protein